MSGCRWRFVTAFAVVAFVCAAAGAGEFKVVPKVGKGPVIDGDLSDTVWTRALVMGDFSLPGQKSAPARATEAKALFDAQGMYLGFKLSDAEPAKVVAKPEAETGPIPTNDYISLFLRSTGDVTEYDAFAVTAGGARDWEHVRRPPIEEATSVPDAVKADGWKPAYKVASKVGQDGWTAEMFIPWADLGGAARKGDYIEAKILRRSRAGSDDKEVSMWPAGAPRDSFSGYYPLYFESANALANPDMSIKDAGVPRGWWLEGAAGAFAPATVDGKKVIHVNANSYATAAQRLTLAPNSLYVIQATTKGTGGFLMRVRLREKSNPIMSDATVKPSEDYVETLLRFRTGETGAVDFNLGVNEFTAKGESDIKSLVLANDVAMDSYGRPISIYVGRDNVIKKLLVADCRAVRGFVGAPVDGSLASWDWAGALWEYNMPYSGSGVQYFYRHNDGLHIKLADTGGFHQIIVRGGVKADVYRDVQSYEGPGKAALITSFPGRTRDTSRVYFNQPVNTQNVSFFNVSDGRIADVTFLRFSGFPEGTTPSMTWPVAAAPVEVDNLPDRLSARFGEGDRTCYAFSTGATGAAGGAGATGATEVAGGAAGAGAIEAPAGKFIHFVSAPLPEETPLDALGIDIFTQGFEEDMPMTVRIQDPVDSRRELFGGDFNLTRPERLRLAMDFPNQILPRGARVWISLRFAGDVKITNAAVDFYRMDRAAAAPEALAYRKLILKTLYCSASEARPWNSWKNREAATAWLSGKVDVREPGLDNIRGLVETLDHCRYIGADSEVTQYYEWIWRWPLKAEGKAALFAARFDEAKGAPEWAVVAHQAWMQSSAVAKWWLDNRLVRETGEFGSMVGDDTDLYQNWVNLPMFETDGVGGELKAAGATFAELADRTNMVDGVNRVTMDPLHAYEEGMNHEALMSLWFYGDPVYLERNMAAAKSVEALTFVTPSGNRFFKSDQVGADTRNDATLTRDGGFPQPLHPVFELARYNGNPSVVKWLREYGDSWLKYMTPGQYASSIDVKTEKAVETGATPAPGGYGAQGSMFEYLYWITGDAKYIRPFMDAYKTGSAATSPAGMVAELYHRGALDAVDAASIKKVLEADGAATAAATGDKTLLVKQLKDDITELQRFGAMYTSAEPFTDRVFLDPVNNVTKAYTGGFAGRNKFCWTHAASYEGLGTDYAALVLAARPDKFKVLIYNFAEKETRGKVRLWTLQHGRYKLTAGIDANGDDKADKVERDETVEVMRATPVDVTLAPKALTVIELVQTEKLDNELERADLAISPVDMKVTDSAVEVVVHNIGAGDAPATEVVLVDPAGKVQASRPVAAIAAPVDLAPRRISVSLPRPGAGKGWAVVVDPDDKVGEIFEGDNRVEIGSQAK